MINRITNYVENLDNSQLNRISCIPIVGQLVGGVGAVVNLLRAVFVDLGRMAYYKWHEGSFKAQLIKPEDDVYINEVERYPNPSVKEKVENEQKGLSEDFDEHKLQDATRKLLMEARASESVSKESPEYTEMIVKEREKQRKRTLDLQRNLATEDLTPELINKLPFDYHKVALENATNDFTKHIKQVGLGILRASFIGAIALTLSDNSKSQTPPES